MSSADTSGNHSDNIDNTEYTHSKDNTKSRKDCDSDCSEEYTYTITEDCDDTRDCHRYSDDSCDGKKKRQHRRNCDDECGLKHSNTPVGVWNLVFQFETTTNASSTLDRPTQLLLHADGTFTNHSTPDLKNNPFNELLSPGIGVWHEIGGRKLKLESTNIGYKASDGSPMVYYKNHITMKLNRRGTKSHFWGEAVPKDLTDPCLCTDTSGAVVCFSGCGCKVLEPRKC